jgi:hypothetical protein
MSSRTDVDRRAYAVKNLRDAVDHLMDDAGADVSAGGDARRASWKADAFFWATVVAAFPAGQKAAPKAPVPPGKSRPLPPRDL